MKSIDFLEITRLIIDIDNIFLSLKLNFGLAFECYL